MRQVSINKTRRPLVLAAVLIGTFMTAVEATIVATAMPSIVADLGGFSLYSWVFSIYLIMQVLTIPIYGKLADLYGRAPIYAIGASIFLIGSLLCGFAPTMTMLIIFRLIQGIGARAIQPLALTIVGDIYSIEERGKIQGLLASVWGISSIIGPVLGSVFVVYTHWAWVFWVNIPIGIIAVIGLLVFLQEEVEKKRHHIDIAGILLLFVSISALMIVFMRGGISWPWISTPVILLLLLFFISLIAFIIQEKKAIDPVIPLSIWRNPIIVVANFTSLTAGAVLLGLSTFIPIYIQGVMGRTPLEAGFILAIMSIGWSLASILVGSFMLRFGFRRMALMGGLSMAIGALLFVLIQPELGMIYAGFGSFFIGIGMGLAITTYIIAVQNGVEWKERGAATASNMFMRNIGSAIGTAMLGGVLNTMLLSYFHQHPQQAELGLDIQLTNEILEPGMLGNLPEETMEVVKEGLALSLQSVYMGVFIIALITLLITFFFWPKERGYK